MFMTTLKEGSSKNIRSGLRMSFTEIRDGGNEDMFKEDQPCDSCTAPINPG
jgi:hypothetical protein